MKRKLKEITMSIKTRKNVEYQWSEYIVYIVCKSDKILTTFEEIEKSFVPDISKGYFDDLLKADKTVVMNYYNKFNFYFQKLKLNVLDVFLLGKNQNRYPEIKKLHENFDKKKGKLKADIIVKTDNGFVGFSVKSSENDTLTNYSVYKMLPEEEVKILKELQLSIIIDNKLSTTKEIYKKNREKYNKLFSNEISIDNEYHKLLNENIIKYKEDILRDWYKNLFGNIGYTVYTFNGITLTNDTISPEFIDIKPIQNPAKNPQGAAKLFYILYNGETPIYKWEIRWKGDIFISPQILTFKWNPDKDQLKFF